LPWPLALIAFLATVLAAPRPADAQAIETVGTRALGMGGAFVAVANDSTTTWWNPAGLAAGPFADVTVSGGRAPDGMPSGSAARASTWGLAIATPVLGASYYRLRITDIDPVDPIVMAEAGRQAGRVGVLPESLEFGQFGATIGHSIFPRLHAGATLKLVRTSVEGASAGAGSGTHFDADVGLLGSVGPVRIGVVARQLAEPLLWSDPVSGTDLRLGRQVRVGLAFDGDFLGVDRSLPLVVSLDVDALSYDTIGGRRRTVAVGAERWVLRRRVGVRGGARVNTTGAHDAAASVGASLSIAKGVLAEVHATAGARAERGWGVAARASF
jgi:hypothetical protein